MFRVHPLALKVKPKACRTLDAKSSNDIVQKKYQIGTKVGRFFF